uniref:BED-type domain-containing protein n=1 Tax=Heterorhabditis bacteriophora TaxID=37862 RepID=A0A1I7WQ04_HETBA
MKSDIWKYFDKSGCPTATAKCSLCRQFLSISGSSTKGMWSHLMRKHVNQYDELKRLKIKTTVCQENTENQHQRFAPIFNIQKKLCSKKKDEFDKAVFKFIIYNYLPFRTVESPSFKNLLRIALPNYSPPSRRTVAGELLSLEYALIKQEIAKDLIGRKFSITADGWTAPNSKVSLFSVTAHFLNEDFDSKNNVIGAKSSAEVRHTADYINEIIKNCLQEYGVDSSSVSVFIHDSAATMVKCASLLGAEWF